MVNYSSVERQEVYRGSVVLLLHTTNRDAGTDNLRTPRPPLSKSSDKSGVIFAPLFSKPSPESGVCVCGSWEKSTSHPLYMDSIQSTSARDAGVC